MINGHDAWCQVHVDANKASVSDRKSSDTQLILVSLDILLDRGIWMAPPGTGRLVQLHSVMDKSPSLTGASPIYYTRTCGALRRARPVAGDDVNQYAVGASNWIIRNFIQNIWYFVSGSFWSNKVLLNFFLESVISSCITNITDLYAPCDRRKKMGKISGSK